MATQMNSVNSKSRKCGIFYCKLCNAFSCGTSSNSYYQYIYRCRHTHTHIYIYQWPKGGKNYKTITELINYS